MPLLDRIFAAQNGHLFPWAPVALGCGIALFFGLRMEPPVWALWLAAGGGAVLALAALACDIGARAVLFALALVALGLALAGQRTHRLAGPVLDFRYYGPVEGRVVRIDRSASDALRITLDGVRLRGVSPNETPQRVRVALHGKDAPVTPRPGAIVGLTAHLSPPGGPVEPGGFDFQRHAWFLRLGAVGYSRVPLVRLDPALHGRRLDRWRMDISRAVQDRLPGPVGAFAAAVTTGDRSGMGQGQLQALRDSNLAHLLAISGLHMGLLSGFVFGVLRLAMALVPPVALRWPAKKLAAGGALVAAAGYLAMSGGNVATERAFVMAAVALTAVMIDRRVLSLRSVALAALIVLLLRPEALLGPGFQMSFAATTALVAAFGALRGRMRDWPRWSRPVTGVVISSSVAGAATAPFAAAHFNQMAVYGLAANLTAVPVMGVLVVPAGVAAALLAPLRLEGPALWAMGQGLAWILWVADTAAGAEGAVRGIVRPGPLVLPLLVAGGFVLALWQGRARLAGLAPAALALALWPGTPRPDILIAEGGTLVGVLGPGGRALSKPRGAGFVAGAWLENDGDRRDQVGAAAGWRGDGGVQHVSGKRAAAAFSGCAEKDIVVFSVAYEAILPCRSYGPDDLALTGAVALYATDAGYRRVTARDITGERMWNSAELRGQ